jgi:pyroglutamyl-peptidase
MSRPVLLVTGFGPFPGVPANPSAVLARRLARLRRPALAPFDVKLAVLPTRWDGLDGLGTLIAREKPAAVLLLGVAARRRQVSIEARAVNGARAAPDAAKAHPPGPLLAPGEAPVRTASARLAPLLAALGRHGVPAHLSRDAGRYLCNAAYFRALVAAGRAPVVFVHLPGRTGRPIGVGAACMERALGDLLVALAAQARGGGGFRPR